MVRRKSVHSKSKQASVFKKIFQLFFLILLIFFFVIFILFVFFILAAPKIENKNIVFVPSGKSGGEGKIIFALFNKNPDNISVIGLDKKITNQLIGGYGDYQLGALHGILEIDKKGSVFERAAFSNFLEMGVDEVVEVNFDQLPTTKIELATMMIKNKNTFSDALVVKNIDQGSLEFVEVNSLEDWQKHINSSVTRQLNDNCSVAVVNATEESGIASLLSNILENSGVSVVRSTNNIWGESETKLYIGDSSEDCGEVLDRIQSVSPIELTTEVNKNETARFRANIVFFIGEELSQQLTE